MQGDLRDSAGGGQRHVLLPLTGWVGVAFDLPVVLAGDQQISVMPGHPRRSVKPTAIAFGDVDQRLNTPTTERVVPQHRSHFARVAGRDQQSRPPGPVTANYPGADHSEQSPHGPRSPGRTVPPALPHASARAYRQRALSQPRFPGDGADTNRGRGIGPDRTPSVRPPRRAQTRDLLRKSDHTTGLNPSSAFDRERWLPPAIRSRPPPFSSGAEGHYTLSSPSITPGSWPSASPARHRQSNDQTQRDVAFPTHCPSFQTPTTQQAFNRSSTIS
jgi:hypothetical protein